MLPTPYAIYAGTTAMVPWSGIAGLPAGFSDGVDNDTLYSAGTGLALAATTFSLDVAYTDSRYVLKAGDTMTGDLVVPNLTVSGTVTSRSLLGPTALMTIKSEGDLEFTIDKSDDPALFGFFEVFNGAGAHVFSADETGNAHVYGDLNVNGSVTAANFVGSGAGLTDVVVPDGSIATAKLANNAVTSAKIADGTITSADIQDSTIANSDLGNNAVTSAKIADGAVTSADIADGTVSSVDIADGAVTSAKVADGAIGLADLDVRDVDTRYVNITGDVMTGALTAPDLTVSGTVSTHSIDAPTLLSVAGVSDIELTIDKDNNAALLGYFEIFNGAGGHVFSADEAGNSHTFGNHTVDGTVKAATFTGSGAGLTDVTVPDGSITTAKLANNAVTSAKIVDGTVANADLANNAVTSAKIADGTITSADIADGTVTSADILDGTVATADLANDAVTSAKIADGTVTSADLADATVGLTDLNLASVDARYVNTAGDVMTGDLTVPDLTASGTITSSTLLGPSSIMSMRSQGDIEFKIDSGNSTNLSAFFEVFNGAGNHVFFVNEAGNSRTYGNHTVDGTVTAAGFSGNGSGLTTAGLVRATVLNVNCGSSVAYTTTYTKVADIGTFSKQLAGSTMEITFNGRIYVDSMLVGATGAIFELRVDNNATSTGRARASLRRAEVGGGGVPVSIAGIFTGLGAGNHTVSMWIQGAYAGGSGATLDPGCWSTDHVVVKELK